MLVSTRTLVLNKAEGMIWSLWVMCLCTSSEEAFHGRD
nr:hypothetical protein Iba_chr07bCG1690 [Ipomoea batatas]GMD17205.1 hypothetical protein Iba_chr07dCG1340 [Ipomoea batatas]